MKNQSVRWACVLAMVVGGVAFGQDQPATPSRPVRGLPQKPAPAPTPAPATPAAPTPAVPASSDPAQPATPAAPVVTPATPAAPGQPKEPPKVGPYVKQTSPKDLTLAADVRIHLDNHTQTTPYRDPFSGQSVNMPNITPMSFNTLSFVFPMVPSTGSSDLFVDEYNGVLRVNGTVVQENHRVLSGYPGGTKLAIWDTGSPDTTTEARQVELHVEAPMRCYDTEFDEAGAMAVGWPNAWPADVASSLKPQLFVELGVDGTGQVRPYDDKVIKATMKTIFEDKGFKDIKRIPPVRVAKMITGYVWGKIQTTGDGLVFMRTGEMSGMDIMPPDMTLTDGKGSEQDMTVTLAALLKKAGLPTRTVIGYDVSTKDNKFLEKNKNNKLRSWVEFALYDEPKNTINWVSIDLARMRKSTSRPPAIDRTWNYFGTNDEFNQVTPFALQFHPPTDVVAYGSPGFWGWFVTPAPAKNAEQAIRFMATVSAKKGGEGDKDPKNPKKDDHRTPVKRGY